MAEWETLFDAHVAVRPPLDEEAFKAIPAKRGVLLLTAEYSRPILLTTAADIRARLRFRLSELPADDQLHKTADLREITAGVHWKLAHSPFETEWQFLELARAIYPQTYTDLLSHRPAWFVGVKLDEPMPVFSRTQQIGPPGRQFGPFPDKQAAEHFVEALVDAFDLCRCYSILKQAPRGVACPYKQMGRCAAPCDGTGSLDDYRAVVTRAADYAAGRREPERAELARRMRQAAEQMRYEQAAACKARLDRLAALDGPKFAQARPLEDCRYVLIQAGPKAWQACAFVCDRGAMARAGMLDYPLQAEQVQAVLENLRHLAAGHEAITEEDRWRLGLLTAYLFTAEEKRGLIVRVAEDLTTEALMAAIEQAAGSLKLRARRRGKAKANSE